MNWKRSEKIRVLDVSGEEFDGRDVALRLVAHPVQDARK